uniref:Uncharacterized protein n=1 Tax=Romanomermis culicivorax TaxID=13658 RepID=A0A915JX26_ROMCU
MYLRIGFMATIQNLVYTRFTVAFPLSMTSEHVKLEKNLKNLESTTRAKKNVQSETLAKNFVQWLWTRRRSRKNGGKNVRPVGVVNVHFETDENGGKDTNSKKMYLRIRFMATNSKKMYLRIGFMATYRKNDTILKSSTIKKTTAYFGYCKTYSNPPREFVLYAMI